MKKNNTTIDAYLPKKVGRRFLIQAKVPDDIFIRVKASLQNDNITWQDLIVASLKRYLDERKA